jgi:hypothetical protein
MIQKTKEMIQETNNKDTGNQKALKILHPITKELTSHYNFSPKLMEVFIGRLRFSDNDHSSGDHRDARISPPRRA